ncbi:MAG TPA: sn-glycerol-3-phosphate ABC transporter substrate-binding protein UgpB [Burkholderiales bacterium]|nr:sn-glycerol-3-phosphate ABC transporter substrate-binding protein UgpB [Burkholderiales bacterium]
MTGKRFLPSLFSALGLALGAAVPAHAVTDIQFWHAMDGALGTQMDLIVQRFNASQKDYRVVAAYKGSYDETLAAGLAARLQNKAPHILQVYDVGTANVAAAKNAIKPLYQLMREAGEKFDAKAFVPAVASYYSDSKGNLLSLPFNTSTPVLYVNRDAFEASGVDRRKQIKTWYDLQEALLEVREKAHLPCGLTTTWPSWVMLENTLAWHNEEFATRNNGYDGLDAQLVFNTRLAIRHLSLMTAWAKAKIFTYSGRRDEGEARFARGECASLTASSASYANLARGAKFRFAVQPLPYYDDINEAPHNTLMGGASLWAMGGKSAGEYKGVAKFFEFVSQPEVQAEWHQTTGYLPVTRAAYELTKAAGFYQKNPGTDVGIQEMINGGRQPMAYSRGIRLGNYLMIRAVVDEELEQSWALQKPPKQALDDAVRRGNDLLRRFERANK